MSLAHGFTQKNTDKNLANRASDCLQTMLKFLQLTNGCGTSCISRPSQWLKNKKNPFLVQLSVLSGRNYKEQLCH